MEAVSESLKSALVLCLNVAVLSLQSSYSSGCCRLTDGGSKAIHGIYAELHALLYNLCQIRWLASTPAHRDTVRRMASRGTTLGVLIGSLVVAFVITWGTVIGVVAFLAFRGVEGSTVMPRPLPSPSASIPAPSGLEQFYQQDITWTECGSAECATIQVPLDYSTPDGPAIDLALTKVPATGKAIGSLLVNPGGPGGSAVEYAQAASFIVTPQITENFDIVGFDPRGVGQSTPVECMTDEQLDEYLVVDGTPDTPFEEQQLVDANTWPGKGCEQSSDPVFRHMSTQDVARDMDIVRAVLGDPYLNYLGKSYGSMLGLVYAELFPTNVGRMVLDGILPADLDLQQLSLGQAKGFEVAFNDFARYCAEQSDCPFPGDATKVATALRAWLQSLDSNPMLVGDRVVNEPVASWTVLSYLYFPEYDYPELLDGLKAAVVDQDATQLLEMLDVRISRGPDGKYMDNSSEAFYAVTCLDRPYDISVDQVRSLARNWQDIAPTFGRALAWGVLSCNDWPAVEDTPMMEVTAKGSAPILIVSTLNDPATPHEWGLRVSEQLENGRLITWDSYNHTAYNEGSSCITDAVDDYFLTGALPPQGTVCK